MPFRLVNPRRHSWLPGLVLLAVVVRALIPAGFMPAGNGRLGLQICPDGFPPALLAHAGGQDAHAGHHDHHASGENAGLAGDGNPSTGNGTHDHRSWVAPHCAFAAVAGAPPLSYASAVVVLGLTSVPSLEQDDSARVPQKHRFRIAQPRAPPALA